MATVAALAAVPQSATAQAYPARPVRWIVPVAPGGTLDITARLIGQWLSERLGQPFVIENRPGAGTNIGTEMVVRAPADGHTLLLVPSSASINPALYEKLGFRFVRDIAPVAGISRVPLVMVVNPSLPVKTIPEFVAYARANRGKLAMGSGGNGSTAHLGGELFRMMAGIEMQHVPYRGGAPALTDLIGGQVQVVFSPIPDAIEHIRGGRLRALAITSATRSEALPDTPPVADFMPGYEASTWNGLGAPRNTPVAIINRLNATVNAGLADPRIKARLADMGSHPLPGSPADFARLIAEETAKWGKVVKASGIRPD